MVQLEVPMTPAERQELLECSQRIAELLYQDACEQSRPVSNLGAIESTVRTQVQESVLPTIGEFFANKSAAPTTDTPVS